MGEDASLDDFLGGSDETPDDGAADEERAKEGDEELVTADQIDAEPAAETEADETVETTDTVEPAATTYAWDGTGTACAACGEAVERRWQQDGGLVCGACKDW